MAYGVQLFDAKGNELVGRFNPTFVAAVITSPASGTKAYPVVEGKLWSRTRKTYSPQAVQKARLRQRRPLPMARLPV